MPYPPTAEVTDSVLEKVYTELVSRISNMKDEDTAPLWNKVVHGPLTGIAALSCPAVGLEHGHEDNTNQMLWPHEEKEVMFFCEFRFNPIMNIASYKIFRYYLAKLQQRLFGTQNNITLGDRVVNVFEISNNPQIEGLNDSNPGGLIQFKVQYRTWTGDPYHYQTETASYPYGSL